ncbi:MAG: Do family serine endopeptidase [Deltaproteobacteria bacterium]|nr:Do family serine endopeptidase [Deltaproteobacteria bacterium]
MRVFVFLLILSAFCQDTLVQMSERFQSIAKEVTDSIVSIQAFVKNQRPNLNDPFFDQFRRFFGDDFFENFPMPGDNVEPALGTGVIISEDGHVVTNDHVAGRAEKIRVTFSDGKEEFAELVGSDSRTDIAVLKVKRKDLRPAKLGDSDALSVGEWVLAIGNPFGLTNTVTAGIVSAKGRSLLGGNQYEDFIQTDAAINPGNSGGPLVNLKGEVVGINTAIFSRSGGYMGIGFAIPSNMVRNVVDQILKKGKVVRGWLGVSIQKLTPELSESFGYNSTRGVLVGQVQPNSPASKAGLETGDIIAYVDDIEITDTNQLRNLIASKQPGSSVNVRIFRKGKFKNFKVTLGELPETEQVAGSKRERSEGVFEKLGLALQNLTPEAARQLGTSRRSGVVVVRVRPGSMAQLSGFAPQDIIIEANGSEINNLEDLNRVVTKEALQKGVRFIVENRGVTRFVFLRTSD